MRYASQTTRVTASQTASQILSGNSVVIYAILLESSANSQVTLLTGDGGTTLATPRVLANDTQVLTFGAEGWLADNGLSVTTPANTTVTVWHSSTHA